MEAHVVKPSVNMHHSTSRVKVAESGKTRCDLPCGEKAARTVDAEPFCGGVLHRLGIVDEVISGKGDVYGSRCDSEADGGLVPWG